MQHLACHSSKLDTFKKWQAGLEISGGIFTQSNDWLEGDFLLNATENVSLLGLNPVNQPILI